MGSKVLLLDMDGVVTKNKMLSSAIKNRVNAYVKKMVNKRISNKAAAEYNKHLYMNHGHTLLGLQKEVDINITLDDFCDYVYDKNFLNSIKFENEPNKEMNKLIDNCRKLKIPIYIFSNAPEIWCKKVLNHMEIDDTIEILGCDHYLYNFSFYPSMCLKPNYITYIKVMNYLNKSYNKPEKILFVDDSIKNIIPMMDHPQWKTIWMNNSFSNPHIYSKTLNTINTLDELYTFF